MLIIGPLDEETVRDLNSSGWDGFKIRHENLPTAGMRAYKSMTPDVVLFTYGEVKRSMKLAEAVRDQPMGDFVELFIQVAPDRIPSDRDTSLNFFTPNHHISELKTAIFQELGIDSPTPEASTDPTQQLPTVGSEDSDTGHLEDLSGASEMELSRIEEKVTEGEIQNKYHSVQHENYFRILEISSDTSDTDARHMYEILSRRYDPENLDPRLVDKCEDQLRKIQDGLEDAWAVLGDKQLREEYLSENEAKAPS
jgi:hypothetical protein